MLLVKLIKYCMWLLVIMMFSAMPPGINDTKGSISVRVGTKEECYHMKERIEQMQFDRYRMKASCVFKGT